MKIPTRRNILLIALLALIIIQLVPMDKTNPSLDPNQDFAMLTSPNEQVLEKLKAACYDCHSHESTYPWYTKIQPFGWWIKGHIKGGRQHLNFSQWGTYSLDKQSHKIEECIEEMQERNMPLKSYTWVHSDAQLTEADIELLSNWLSTIAAK